MEESPTMEEDIDIYADLTISQDIKPIEQCKICPKLETQIDEYKKKVQDLQKVNQILKKNFSSLLMTAKGEVSRKDRMIAEIRRQLDDASFRRGNFKRHVNYNYNFNPRPNEATFGKDGVTFNPNRPPPPVPENLKTEVPPPPLPEDFKPDAPPPPLPKSHQSDISPPFPENFKTEFTPDSPDNGDEAEYICNPEFYYEEKEEEEEEEDVEQKYDDGINRDTLFSKRLRKRLEEENELEQKEKEKKAILEAERKENEKLQNEETKGCSSKINLENKENKTGFVNKPIKRLRDYEEQIEVKRLKMEPLSDPGYDDYREDWSVDTSETVWVKVEPEPSHSDYDKKNKETEHYKNLEVRNNLASRHPVLSEEGPRECASRTDSRKNSEKRNKDEKRSKDKEKYENERYENDNYKDKFLREMYEKDKYKEKLERERHDRDKFDKEWYKHERDKFEKEKFERENYERKFEKERLGRKRFRRSVSLSPERNHTFIDQWESRQKGFKQDNFNRRRGERNERFNPKEDLRKKILTPVHRNKFGLDNYRSRNDFGRSRSNSYERNKEFEKGGTSSRSRSGSKEKSKHERDEKGSSNSRSRSNSKDENRRESELRKEVLNSGRSRSNSKEKKFINLDKKITLKDYKERTDRALMKGNPSARNISNSKDVDQKMEEKELIRNNFGRSRSGSKEKSKNERDEKGSSNSRSRSNSKDENRRDSELRKEILKSRRSNSKDKNFINLDKKITLKDYKERTDRALMNGNPSARNISNSKDVDQKMEEKELIRNNFGRSRSGSKEKSKNERDEKGSSNSRSRSNSKDENRRDSELRKEILKSRRSNSKDKNFINLDKKVILKDYKQSTDRAWMKGNPSATNISKDIHQKMKEKESILQIQKAKLEMELRKIDFERSRSNSKEKGTDLGVSVLKDCTLSDTFKKSTNKDLEEGELSDSSDSCFQPSQVHEVEQKVSQKPLNNSEKKIEDKNNLGKTIEKSSDKSKVEKGSKIENITNKLSQQIRESESLSLNKVLADDKKKEENPEATLNVKSKQEIDVITTKETSGTSQLQNKTEIPNVTMDTNLCKPNVKVDVNQISEQNLDTKLDSELMVNAKGKIEKHIQDDLNSFIESANQVLEENKKESRIEEVAKIAEKKFQEELEKEPKETQRQAPESEKQNSVEPKKENLNKSEEKQQKLSKCMKDLFSPVKEKKNPKRAKSKEKKEGKVSSPVKEKKSPKRAESKEKKEGKVSSPVKEKKNKRKVSKEKEENISSPSKGKKKQKRKKSKERDGKEFCGSVENTESEEQKIEESEVKKIKKDSEVKTQNKEGTEMKTQKVEDMEINMQKKEDPESTTQKTEQETIATRSLKELNLPESKKEDSKISSPVKDQREEIEPKVEVSSNVLTSVKERRKQQKESKKPVQKIKEIPEKPKTKKAEEKPKKKIVIIVKRRKRPIVLSDCNASTTIVSNENVIKNIKLNDSGDKNLLS